MSASFDAMSGPEMTGPEHYREAERLLEQAASWEDGGAFFAVDSGIKYDLAAAQVHATLALAAATALPTIRTHEDAISRAWAGVAS